MDTPVAENEIERPPLTVSLRARPMLVILTLFWVYVTLSNVAYAWAMQYYLSAKIMALVFAPWQARVVQHVLLYPALLGAIWLSLRIGWRPLWRAVPLQMLIALGFSVLAHPALQVSERIVMQHPEEMNRPGMTWSKELLEFFSGPDSSLWLSSAATFLLTYGFCVALVTGFAFYQRFRDAQLRVSALEQAWSEARLQTLRMQLSPHTLFNLLHTIRGQIAWDPDKAQAMVVQLGDLLRRLLSAGERNFARLSDEVHFAYSYLDLQKQRFPDRLRLEFPLTDVMDTVWVPSLILQPVVENAVVHGLAGHEGPVTVRLEIETRDDVLTVAVSNEFVPRAAVPQGSPGEGRGLGLRNVRERLAVQFGDRASLAAGAVESGLWQVTMRMPLLRDGPVPQPARREAALQA